MTTKNIQDVVAELKKEFIETQCEEMEGEEDLCEVYENDGELVADWWVEKITQLVKEVKAGERKRLENEFGDFAHEHYKGCVREADSTYTYGYDNEVIWLVREFFEKQILTEA